MGKWLIARYGLVMVCLAIAQTGTSWAQPDASSDGTNASIQQPSPRCAVFGSSFADTELIGDGAQQNVSDGILVAEDMRCRQCHGKCEADSLRCRSQCLNESACLSQCEERSSKCTAMCKQLFQCQ